MKPATEILLVFVVLTLAPSARADEQPLRFVLMEKIFWYNDPEDVVPVAQEVGNEIGRQVGREITVAHWDGHVADLAMELDSGSVHFVFSNALDFVRLKCGLLAPGVRARPLAVRPVAAIVSPGDTRPSFTRAVVVVAEHASVSTFADLKGKRFAYGPLSEGSFGMLFLESLVRSEGYERKQDFFGTVRRMSCDDACLIALRRGKADATVMPEATLGAKELVAGKKLNLPRVAASEEFQGFLCFYLEGKVSRELADQIQTELLRIHETPEGARLLQLFHVERLVEPAPGGTQAVERLLKASELDDTAAPTQSLHRGVRTKKDLLSSHSHSPSESESLQSGSDPGSMLPPVSRRSQSAAAACRESG